MRHTVLIALSFITLTIAGTGCSNGKAEREQLMAEKADLQSKLDTTTQERDAAMSLAGQNQQKIEVAKAEMEKTKLDLATLSERNDADNKAAADKIKQLEAAQSVAMQKNQVDAKTAAANLQAARDELAKANSNTASQATAMAEKLTSLQKKIDDLTLENTNLKADLAKAAITPSTSQPTTMP